MSTVADIQPYMQSWLDARTAASSALASFTPAKTAADAAYAAVAARVAAGDTAAMMTAVLTTYVAARTTYVAQDAGLRAAQVLVATRRATFDAMVELLATGQAVPPFGS